MTRAYTVVSASTGKVYVTGVSAERALVWLGGYAAELRGRDLPRELAGLEVGERLSTHPDTRGIRVARTR